MRKLLRLLHQPGKKKAQFLWNSETQFLKQ